MQTQNELKKALLDFLWWHDIHYGFEMDSDKQEEIINEYLKTNKALASVEPEPLAKNKQTENIFICRKVAEGKESNVCSKLCGDGLCF